MEHFRNYTVLFAPTRYFYKRNHSQSLSEGKDSKATSYFFRDQKMFIETLGQKNMDGPSRRLF